MEETYGSKFDSQLNTDSSIKTDSAKQMKTGSAVSRVDKVKDFVSENVSGLQDKMSNLDLNFDWKKALTIASVAGAIGGVAYFRRGKRRSAKSLITKAQNAITHNKKVEKVLHTGAQRLAGKKKAITKAASSART